MTLTSYEIQELVELSNTPRRNIYFYVQQGLLPPPVGAGLAARYGEEHLLRLRLIPALRRQGLRLDQIRERLNGLDAAGLAGLLASVDPAPRPQPAPVSPQGPAIAGISAGQVCTRYDLPGGIVLLVPANLRPEYRVLAERLLAAAGLPADATKRAGYC